MSAAIDFAPVSRGWIGRFGLAWLGFWAANLVPVQLLLPEQLDRIDPSHKVTDFAVLNAVSGAVALLALPVFGAASDRSRHRFGRRRGAVLTGAVAFAAGLVVTGAQTSVVALTVVWALTTLGLCLLTAGLTAVVADRVPEHQRGAVSGAIFAPQALGVVLGIAVVAAFELTSLEGYVVLAVGLLLAVTPFVARYREVPAAATEVLTLRDVLGGFRIDWRRHPDFAWAFAGRLLVNLGNSLGTCYLLYFLTDDLRVDDPDGTLLGITVVYLVAGVITTGLGGVLSDRLGRRRVFVLLAALLQAGAGFLLAGAPTLPVTVAAAALLGGGFGAYMAVDQALVTRVLPDAESRARDLGVMNIGTIVPPAVAPLVAGLVVTSDGRGYPSLFVLVGVFALAGALTTYRIRSVR